MVLSPCNPDPARTADHFWMEIKTAAPAALECELKQFVASKTFSSWRFYRAKQMQLFGLADAKPSSPVLPYSNRTMDRSHNLPSAQLP